MASAQRVELRRHPTSPARLPSLIFAGPAALLLAFSSSTTSFHSRINGCTSGTCRRQSFGLSMIEGISSATT